MMSWFGGLRMRSKLVGSFGVMLALSGAVGATAWWSTATLAVQAHALYASNGQQVELANIERAVWQLRFGIANFMTADKSGQDQIRAQEKDWAAQIQDNAALYEASDLTQEQRDAFGVWQADFANYMQSRPRWFDLYSGGQITEAAQWRADNTNKYGAAQVADLAKLIDLQQQSGASRAAAADLVAQRVAMLLAILLGIAMAVGLTAVLVLTRAITRPLAHLVRTTRDIAQVDLPALAETARALAAGDLTRHVVVVANRVDVSSKDEVGQMANDFNAMVDRLRETGEAFGDMTAGLRGLVVGVKLSADDLATASTQLGSAAEQTGATVTQVAATLQDVAAGAVRTSHSVHETNAAVSDLSVVVDRIARGAHAQAQQVQTATATATRMAAVVDEVATMASGVAAASQETRAAAEHGSTAVHETTAAMSEIQNVVTVAAARVQELGKLGEKIGAVVETIDDIADQTNLLALNAAIEAARAGDHGKGFAVVADEVRKLAERSSRETKAIAELIRQVQAGTGEAVGAMQAGSSKVEQGTAKANQAGRALEEILRAVETTVERVTQIASSAQEMSRAADGVSAGMQAISTVVEENTAATGQMAVQSGQVSSASQSIVAVSEHQSAATEELSASANQMSAQVEEMTAQATELANTAEQLRTLVARFKLDQSTIHLVPVDNTLQLQRAA